MEQNIDNLKTISSSLKQSFHHSARTVCGICSGTCGVTIRISDGNVFAIEGDRKHPVSAGHICPKGRAIPELLRNPDRLRHPSKRIAPDTWEAISWDEAYTLAVRAMKDIKNRYGPEALAVHVGHAGVGKEFLHYAERLCTLFGTPNFSTCGSHCHESKSMANTLTFGAMPVGDFARSKCIILWGKNPASSAPGLVPEILSAKTTGSKIIVVDPRRTALAEKADIHLQLRPGTDGALALAFLRVIIQENLFNREFVRTWTIGFDRLSQATAGYDPATVEKITWIPADKIREAAQLYAISSPACISAGVAIELNTNGFQAARGIAALQAITGNLDVAGGAVFSEEAKLSDLQLISSSADKKPAIGADKYPLFYGATHNAQANLYARAILEHDPYPLKGLVVAGSNPVLTWPDAGRVHRALSKLDFLTVIDPFMTATAKMAHLVMPCASFLGGHELWESSHMSLEPRIGLAPKVCDDALPTNWEIWKEIATRMGYDKFFPWDTEKDAINFRLRELKLTFEDLRYMPEGHIYQKWTPKKFEQQGFKTSSGKIELYSSTLEKWGYDPVPTYVEPSESPLSDPQTAASFPLVLTTGARRIEYLHSRFRNVESLAARAPVPNVEIHPLTAHHYGIEDGDDVFVESLRGRIKVIATYTTSILPGVISLSHGWESANANLLTDDTHLDPVSGFPAARSLLARIRRA